MGRKSREKRERQAGAPLVSCVILVRNNLDLTRSCLESIARHTPEPAELVIVDNASGQETAAYLAGYARQHPHVRLIVNGVNVGFPAGCNQGISAARGEHVVLLNNDVVVTDGWLTRLLVPLERDPAIGIVGPRADRIGGQQAVPAARRVDDFDHFAREWALEHQGQGQAVEWLVGFCLLIRREVVDRIGGLDPRYGLGNFEDNDYCRRARLAGFKLWQADDVLLKHAESATFKSEGVSLDALMKRNGLAFSKKWNGHEPDLFIPPGSSDPVPRPTLSLCLVTCNDGEFLEDCLRSAADLVDEICIVDTGSTDRTVEIAESFGAKVTRAEAGAARTASLEMATGDWLLVLNADERLLPTARLRVPNLAGYGAAAYVFRILSSTGSAVEVSWGARLFRSGARHMFNERRPDPPSIWREEEEGLAVGGSDICHEGYRRSVWDSPDKRLRTAHQVPSTPELDLAQRARNTGAPIEERIQWLRRALAQPWKLGVYAGFAFALLSKLLVEAGAASEGVLAAKAGLAIDSSNTDLWFAWGVALHHSGDPARALECLKQCYIRVSDPESNRIGDVKLSEILEAMNRAAAALGAPPFHLVSKLGERRTLESHPPPELPADSACEVLRWVGSEPVAFSILIPTMANRTGSFERLYAKLKAQAEGKPVEVLAIRDSGELSTGWKREWLNWRAAGEFLAHVDDDDDVADDYVSTLLAAIRLNPGADAVVFDARHYVDGIRKRPMFYSKAYPFLALPDLCQLATCHLMVYRTALARLVEYPDTSHGEDQAWALVAAPMIGKEVRLYKTLYYYRDSERHHSLRRKANDRLATEAAIKAHCEVLRPLECPEPIELSILIPTLGKREERFNALVNELEGQAKGQPVEILAVRDGGQVSTGLKRIWLKSHAAGRYLAFVDDDDRVAPDYVAALLGAIAANPEADCITFDVMRFVDGRPARPALYSKEYAHEDRPDCYRRQPNHLMCFRSALARQEDFPNVSWGEDTAWATAMAPLIEREARIDKVLYHYLDTARKAERVPA